MKKFIIMIAAGWMIWRLYRWLFCPEKFVMRCNCGRDG